MKGVLCFIAGLAVGAAATWFISSKRYEKIIDEEVASVKEQLSKSNPHIYYDLGSKPNSGKYNREELTNKEPIDDYIKKVYNEGYTKEKVDKTDMERPYIISQADFAEYDDYNRFTLSAYSNGVVVDCEEPDIPMDDVDEVIGLANLEEGVQDDWIYVRNDKLKSDYEIYIDPEPFSFED